jgi:hypothetical protein
MWNEDIRSSHAEQQAPRPSFGAVPRSRYKHSRMRLRKRWRSLFIHVLAGIVLDVSEEIGLITMSRSIIFSIIFYILSIVLTKDLTVKERDKYNSRRASRNRCPDDSTRRRVGVPGKKE